MEESNAVLGNKAQEKGNEALSPIIFKARISPSIPEKIRPLIEKLTNGTYEFNATDNFKDIATLIALFEVIPAPSYINLIYQNELLDSRKKRKIINILKCYLIYSAIQDPLFCQDTVKFKNYGDYSEDLIKFPCRKIKNYFLRTRQKDGYEFASFYTPSKDKIKLKKIYENENRREKFMQNLAEESLAIYCPAFLSASEYFNQQKTKYQLENTKEANLEELIELIEEYKKN